VPWNEDPAWSEVLRAAAADSGRSILIDFHAPWCGPCRVMDAMVYNEGAVIDEFAEVVTVKIDIDVPANAGLQEQFGVELLPTLVWCDPDGREVNRFTGYRNAADFLEEVRRFRDEEVSSRTLAERLAADPQDPWLLLEMAGLLTRRGDHARADIFYRRLSTLDTHDEPALRTRGLLGLALAERRAGRLSEAQALGRRAATVGGAVGEVVAFQEVIGDTLGLLETWRLGVAADDTDVVALDGFARTAVAAGVELREASRCAIRAVVLSDREPAVIATLAESYHRRGYHRKALRWIDEAIAAAPDDRSLSDSRTRYAEAFSGDPWGLKRESH